MMMNMSSSGWSMTLTEMLGYPQYGFDLGAEEYLVNVSGKVGKVSSLEPEGTSLVRLG